MTRTEAPTTARTVDRNGLPVAVRLVGIPSGALFGLATLLALSFTGWGTEGDPVAQLVREGAWLLTSALVGAAGGMLHAWGAAGTRHWVLVAGAALGTLPALVMVSAYFTHRF